MNSVKGVTRDAYVCRMCTMRRKKSRIIKCNQHYRTYSTIQEFSCQFPALLNSLICLIRFVVAMLKCLKCYFECEQMLKAKRRQLKIMRNKLFFPWNCECACISCHLVCGPVTIRSRRTSIHFHTYTDIRI